MDATWKSIIWQQFGASIDMLERDSRPPLRSGLKRWTRLSRTKKDSRVILSAEEFTL